MPRMKEDARSIAADIASRLERLAAAARKEGRDEALAELRALVGGAAPARVGRPPKAKAPSVTKSGKKRKNPWAGLSPEEHLARVNAIRKGRGLPLKDKA